MVRVLVVQHVPEEGLGRIAHPALEVTTRFTRTDDVDGVDGLVVLGGPMGAYETDAHPRLLEEMRLIERALARGVPVLGVCLGSQLLAHVLGARVFPSGQLELGWHDVELGEHAARDALFAHAPRVFPALHWHGDVFELPPGAVHLARSRSTAHQAFSFAGAAWGLLFHLEAPPAQVQAMARAFPEDLARAGTTPDALARDTARHEATTDAIAAQVFGAWRALCVREAR